MTTRIGKLRRTGNNSGRKSKQSTTVSPNVKNNKIMTNCINVTFFRINTSLKEKMDLTLITH